MHTRVDGTLIGHREIIEALDGFFQTRALRQLECIESASSHEEQLIALNLADGPQFARELVTLSQQLSLTVAAALSQSAELDCDERHAQEVMLQCGDWIGGSDTHAEASIP